MTTFDKVYAAVRLIPRGSVATYGQIAAAIGNRRLARVVGYALHVNPEPGVIPCHRVVKRDGEVSSAFAFGGANRQVELLKAEGVGSYWPFATGLKVTQANLLLEQIMSAPKTTNVLIPNQHIGAYHVGFMGEWLSREYLARHNGFVREKHLVPARCPLFGYALDEMKLDGQFVRQTFLRPETQSKLGTEGYDAGAKILADFIKEQVAQFVCDDLDPLGKEIIDCCLHDGTLDDYLALTPMKLK